MKPQCLLDVPQRASAASSSCPIAAPVHCSKRFTGREHSRSRTNTIAHAAYPLSSDQGFDELEGATASLELESQRSKVSAEIRVHSPADVLWQVLTDFTSHIDLMPNLEQCEQLPSRRPDAVLLFQKVVHQTPFWRMEASGMLEYRQTRGASWRKMKFSMVSGDFAELSGHWVVASDPSNPQYSFLRYEIVFLPITKALIPCACRHFLLKQVLPNNITALAAHAELLTRGGLASHSQADALVQLEDIDDAELDPLPFSSVPYIPTEDRVHLAPGWIPDRRPMYLGVSSVPLPGQSSQAPGLRLQVAAVHKDVPSTTQDIDNTYTPESSSCAWREDAADDTVVSESTADTETANSPHPFHDIEVHIRKLDTDKRLHWRLLSSVPVRASPEAIWSVLTDYENLHEVIPVMRASELKQPAVPRRGTEAPENPMAGPRDESRWQSRLKRIRQVATKKLPYVQLHTEVILDVLEKPVGDTWELQFKHHKSDFDMLQGKWVIERVSERTEDGPTHVLKYAVELAVHASPSRVLGLMEPLIERGIAEDIPASLNALRSAAERRQKREGQHLTPAAQALKGKAVLQRAEKTYDRFEELRAELTALYGSRMQLPNRKELLASGRVDLINAISAYGGYGEVADKLQWSVAKVTRRPRGYWSSLENVRTELDLFNDEFNLPIGSVPRKAFLQKLGRYDLVKGIEKNGGAQLVASALGYTIASGHQRQTKASKKLSAQPAMEGNLKPGEKPSASQPLLSVSEILADPDAMPDRPELAAGMQTVDLEMGAGRWSGSGSWAEAAAQPLDSVDSYDYVCSQHTNQIKAQKAVRARGQLQRAVRSGRKKLDLNVRDVDKEQCTWVSPSYASGRGRMKLSRADLDSLLSERHESRDSI